jgi:predicted lactoylglutathione lyase
LRHGFQPTWLSLVGNQEDARVPNTVASSLEFSLGYLVGRKKEVDELLRKAQGAGGTITDKPHDRAWGIYSGYFKDLDGHLWEIIWNSRMPIAE